MSVYEQIKADLGYLKLDAAAGAFAATTVVVGLLTDFSSHAAQASVPSPRYRIAVGPHGAVVTGTFW